MDTAVSQNRFALSRLDPPADNCFNYFIDFFWNRSILGRTLGTKHYFFIDKKNNSIVQSGAASGLQNASTDFLDPRYRFSNIDSKEVIGVDKNQQTSCFHPFVPTELGDSSITALSDLVKNLSQNQLRTGIEEQLAILETNGVDLGRFSDYLAENLWSDRQTLEQGLEIDSYANPSVTDVLKVRLLGLYQVGFHPEFLQR